MSIKRRLKSIVITIPGQIWKVKKGDLIEPNRWLSRSIHGYYFVLKLFPKFPFKLFFANNASRIKYWFNEDPSVKTVFISRLFEFYSSSSEKERMFLNCLIAECGLLDDSTSNQILNYQMQSINNDCIYWSTIDSSYAVFGTGKGLYANYYNDRKRIFEKIARESNLIINRQHKEQTKSKICIITYQLNPDLHNSAQRVCSMFANNLVDYCDDLLVLCMDTTTKSNIECKSYCTLIRTPQSSNHRKSISNLFAEGVNVYYSSGKNYIEKAQDSLEYLYNYNPSFIIDLTDEYSPFSYIYSKDYFTVYFPLRVGVSSQFFSKIISEKNNFRIVNNKYNHVLDESMIIDWVFPEYVPEMRSSKNKYDIGLNSNTFVVATIGNNGSIEDGLVDVMKEYLEYNSDCVWLLIGYPAPDYLKNTCQELIHNKKIIEWGYENDLMGLCSACDVVLRQNISGGSGGTAIAAMKGIPIVMTSEFCDANRWLGSDYSKINSYKGLVDEIDRLKKDSLYYADKSREVKNLVSKAIDSKDKWQNLYDLLTGSALSWSKTIS